MSICSSTPTSSTIAAPYYGTAELGPWSYALDEGCSCFQVRCVRAIKYRCGGALDEARRSFQVF